MGKPTPLIKNDFSAGELSPRLKGRVDLPDYNRGLKTCENFIPLIQGPITTRPGTKYVAEVHDSSARSRLIPFKFGTSVSYILEFADAVFKVYKNNAGTYEATSGIAGDVSTAAFANSIELYPSGLNAVILDVRLKPDGLKMYVASFVGSKYYIDQYNLGTAWDISYASLSARYTVTPGTIAAQGLYIKSDGLKMYLLSSDAKVYQFTLSTAWDVTTATYDTKLLDMSAQAPTNGLYFSSDGTKVYGALSGNRTIYQYTLSTPWDVSTGTYANKSYSMSSQADAITGLFINSTGTRVFINDTDEIFSYTLSTAWDISTASYDNLTYDLSSRFTFTGYSIDISQI